MTNRRVVLACLLCGSGKLYTSTLCQCNQFHLYVQLHKHFDVFISFVLLVLTNLCHTRGWWRERTSYQLCWHINSTSWLPWGIQCPHSRPLHLLNTIIIHTFTQPYTHRHPAQFVFNLRVPSSLPSVPFAVGLSRLFFQHSELISFRSSSLISHNQSFSHSFTPLCLQV